MRQNDQAGEPSTLEDFEKVSRHIRDIQQRIALVASDTEKPLSRLLDATFEELGASVEELRVAEEELRV